MPPLSLAGKSGIPAALALLGACSSLPPAPPRIADVNAWAIQLQGLDRPGAVEALAAFPGQMAILEQTRTVRGAEGFDARGAVARIRAGGKICLAYVNAGQAEEYRAYWREEWRGSPLLLGADPDGWPGNHPVAFWRREWREVVLGLVDEARRDGFDGVFLDWVLGYAQEPAVRAAAAAGVDPARAMVSLVADVKKRAGLVLVSNATELVENEPDLRASIDGFLQESVSFAGEATGSWTDPRSGDFPVAGPVEALRRIRDLGIPVFTLDYAADPANVGKARNRSREEGFIPFVSRTPLDRLP